MFKSLPTSSLATRSPSLPVLIFGVVGFFALASAYLGYRLGDEAIKGVAQPSENPIQRLNLPQSHLAKDEKAPTQPTVKFMPLNIEQVKKETKQYIQVRQKTVKEKDASSKKSN